MVDISISRSPALTKKSVRGSGRHIGNRAPSSIAAASGSISTAASQKNRMRSTSRHSPRHTRQLCHHPPSRAPSQKALHADPGQSSRLAQRPSHRLTHRRAGFPQHFLVGASRDRTAAPLLFRENLQRDPRPTPKMASNAPRCRHRVLRFRTQHPTSASQRECPAKPGSEVRLADSIGRHTVHKDRLVPKPRTLLNCR